jgi:hypothetical protein
MRDRISFNFSIVIAAKIRELTRYLFREDYVAGFGTTIGFVAPAPTRSEATELGVAHVGVLFAIEQLKSEQCNLGKSIFYKTTAFPSDSALKYTM